MKPAPGIHRGLPMAEYLSMHAVSASLLQTTVEQCPRAAWFQSWMNPKPVEDDSEAVQNAGTIAHAILLEGRRDGVVVIDPRDHPAEKTKAIPAGWTNKSIKAARDAAIGAGKIPVLIGQMGAIDAMVNEAFAFIESLRDTEPAIYAAMRPGGGESELTIVWEEDDGTLCRIRPDRCSTDWRVTVDYKTGGTTAEPDTWGRTQMVKMGYYGSGAFYRRGIEAATGVRTEYIFLVQEQDPPYLCSLVGMDPASYELGAMKTDLALATWADCMQRGNWPGYPPQVCYPVIPTYEFARWEGRSPTDLGAGARANSFSERMYGDLRQGKERAA